MHQFIAVGDVRPSLPQITHDGPVTHKWLLNNDGTKASITYSLLNSQMTAVINWPHDEVDIESLRNLVAATVSILVDSVGFCRGCAFDIEVRKITAVDMSAAFTFDASIPSLANELEPKYSDEQVNRFLLACSGNNGRYMRRALRDMSLAIRYLEDSAFYCYRAIEALRHYTGAIKGIPGTTPNDEKRQWRALGELVQMNKADLSQIKSFATPMRHGELVNLSSADRLAIIRTSRLVIERFLDVVDGLPLG